MRDSQERLHNILSSIDEVVWSASPDGTQIHYFNSAVEQIWGHPVDDFNTSTGLSEGMRSQDAEKLGAKMVLLKPYTAETLLRALAVSLDH